MLTAAFIIVGLLADTYAGYPLLVIGLARAFPWAGRSKVALSEGADHVHQVTVMVPVHSGASFIEAKLRSVLAQDYPAQLLRVIVYSDGNDEAVMAVAKSDSQVLLL
ncbi:MAG: cellulose synthase/poly-beta-1,6-N-acetylglucosamine synthase-like glycosyltransferase [Myxococcota bacterium]